MSNVYPYGYKRKDTLQLNLLPSINYKLNNLPLGFYTILYINILKEP